MSAAASRPFVSVKFTPAGRTYSFLLPDLALDDEQPAPPLKPGETVVVDTPDGRALATVARVPSALAERRTPAADSSNRVRDEAKMLGGYGSCGRPLCCTTWLKSFEPVSIKMAKQQQLSLNPSKLSGQCGRLKCCLRYELPNGNGVKHGGCADHGECSNPTGP